MQGSGPASFLHILERGAALLGSFKSWSDPTSPVHAAFNDL